MREVTKSTTTGDNLDISKKIRFIGGDRVNIHVDDKAVVLKEIVVVEETDDDGNTVKTTDLYFTTEA
ncbi:MAG: hypothetical protein IKE69_11455 [Thermoguttaceae bacterium]|nr:hypothetical protein [Thermoguttaceae bacterium]